MSALSMVFESCSLSQSSSVYTEDVHKAWRIITSGLFGATHSILDTQLNLLSVACGARVAMLLEPYNSGLPPDISHRVQKIVEKLADNGFFIEAELERTFTRRPPASIRLLIYSTNVPDLTLEDIDNALENEKVLGRILGFTCPGEHGARDKEGHDLEHYSYHTVAISQMFENVDEVDLITEVCRKSDPKKEHKLKENACAMQAVISVIFPDVKVKVRKEHWLSHAQIIAILRSDEKLSKDVRYQISNFFWNKERHDLAKEVDSGKDSRKARDRWIDALA